MLEIQPSITQKSVRVPAFTNRDNFDEETYRQKRAYYENKKEGFESLINDEHIPSGMKTGAKICKIVSVGMVDGLAVAYGAATAGKFTKTVAKNFAKTKIFKGAEKIAEPLTAGMKTSGEKLLKALSEEFNKLKTTKFITNIKTKFNNIIEKMNESKTGSLTVGMFNSIGNGLKYVGEKISKVANRVFTAIKGITYDKAVKVGATTLGVGSGLAGSYGAARKAGDKDEDSNPILREQADSDTNKIAEEDE